jgi:hypothetical protein
MNFSGFFNMYAVHSPSGTSFNTSRKYRCRLVILPFLQVDLSSMVPVTHEKGYFLRALLTITPESVSSLLNISSMHTLLVQPMLLHLQSPMDSPLPTSYKPSNQLPLLYPLR